MEYEGLYEKSIDDEYWTTQMEREEIERLSEEEQRIIEDAHRNYTEVGDYIRQIGGRVATDMEVYTDLFRLGDDYLEREMEAYLNTGERVNGEAKSNPIALYKTVSGKTGKDIHNREVLYDDSFDSALRSLQEQEFAGLSGLTYMGRNNMMKYASKMYAFIIDLDGVQLKNIKNFVSGTEAGVYPMPNYMVQSGHGLHLYYIMAEPIDLDKDKSRAVIKKMSTLKESITKRIWNKYTSTVDYQSQGINQAFRVIGGRTKIPGLVVKAYALNKKKWNIYDFNSYIAVADRITEIETTSLSLAEAEERYPEWAEKRKKAKEDGVIHTKKGWSCSRKVYEWWLTKLRAGEIGCGNRYHAIMVLAIYGIKCSDTVSFEEVKRDAYSLHEQFNSLDESNPFKIEEIDAALKAYNIRFKNYPISAISARTGIQINKQVRKYNSQANHLQLARLRRDQKHPNNSWRNNEGRPNKEELVLKYISDNPEQGVSEIARALGVSRNTVYKYKRK